MRRDECRCRRTVGIKNNVYKGNVRIRKFKKRLQHEDMPAFRLPKRGRLCKLWLEKDWVVSLLSCISW